MAELRKKIETRPFAAEATGNGTGVLDIDCAIDPESEVSRAVEMADEQWTHNLRDSTYRLREVGETVAQ